MARTTSTNFTGVLDFTLATAATDLFKKEDVQVLAQAVDLHDHTSGKGLTIGAGAIPNSSITSAMIVDGTIQGADMAAGAALANLSAGSLTRSALATITAASTTTTTPYVVSGPDIASWASLGGLIHATWVGQVSCSVKGAIISMFLGWASGGSMQPTQMTAVDVNYAMPLQLDAYLSAPGVATHDFQVYWGTNAGTLSMVGNRSIVIFEFAR